MEEIMVNTMNRDFKDDEMSNINEMLDDLTLYFDILKGVNEYLDRNYQKGMIIEGIYNKAKTFFPINLGKWMFDRKINSFAPNFKDGLKRAVRENRWDHISEAFYTDIAFGTAGIRGMAAFTENEFDRFKEKGIDAPVLKGPNTMNNVVLLLKTAGVAQWAADKKLSKVVIGYDSRMHGKKFAELIAKTFLGAGVKVFLFDEACPYPELTFAIPTVGADFGILISASHNDKRYNGYKLSSKTGAQFDPDARNEIFEEYIVHATLENIELKDLSEADEKQLVFLGGDKKLPEVNYYNCELRDIHSQHINHIKKFLKFPEDWLKQNAPTINVGYTAYFGVGYRAVPRLLRELHFRNTVETKELNKMDGSFPSFDLEQQPDPGDPIAAEVAVNELKRDLADSDLKFKDLDITIGTDPDADRTGIIIKVSKEEEEFVKKISDTPVRRQITYLPPREDYSWMLLDADNAWTILLWYRLMMDEKNSVKDNHKKFIVLSHTTTDAIEMVARKYGIGVIKTWVGFALISNVIQKVWNGEDISPENNRSMIYKTHDMKNRSINIAGLEQSNGFSILGSKPVGNNVFEDDGHVRDKDGTFAAILLAELAAYAKVNNTTIAQLLNEKIYLDPDIGLFINYYEPSPYWGQFEGLTGFSKKIRILEKVKKIQKDFEKSGNLEIAGLKVVRTEFYGTGKYDELHGYPKNSFEFPDEGIRFFFDDTGFNHLTVRPSGTSQCLRYHVQLKAEDVNRDNLTRKKIDTYELARKIAEEIRRIAE
jgi:phosphoglucomutase